MVRKAAFTVAPALALALFAALPALAMSIQVSPLNSDGNELNGDQRRNPPFASNSRVLLPSQNFTLSCFLCRPLASVNN